MICKMRGYHKKLYPNFTLVTDELPNAFLKHIKSSVSLIPYLLEDADASLLHPIFT